MNKKNKLLKIIIVIIFEVIVITSLLVLLIINPENSSMVSLKINKEEPFKSSLKPLSITLNDLPEGYKITQENNLSDEEEEIYQIEFEYFGIEPENYSNITVDIYKFNTVDNATNFLNGTKEGLYRDFYNITEISKEIGEQSCIVIINTSDSWKDSYVPMITTDISFRISNIVCFVGWEHGNNFDYIFDMAKIVEQRINDSIL